MDKNIKNILIQYCDLKRDRQARKRISNIRKQSEMASDVVQNGYKRHAVIFGVDITRVGKLKS